MTLRRTKLFIFLVFSLLSYSEVIAQTQDDKKTVQEFELEIEAEYRYFFDEGQFEGQERSFPSIAFLPSYSIAWNEGYESVNFTGFFRLDKDKERTHWDIRELYYQKAHSNWELNIGLRKVFWGVTEINHLVDIINQTDQIESFDGEEKLGQPMVQFTLSTNKIGSFDFFYLPYHRKRTLPGEKGRFRFSEVIYTDDVGYESSAEEWRQDLAFRWSHYFGPLDIGVSQFYGNGREPIFFPDVLGNVSAFYPVISQTGIDLQVTHNAFLWKLESIYRYAKAQEFVALTAGLEYTFSNIDGNGLDIGVLGEYLYDGRDELALNSSQNDIFIGTRIAFNDTKDTSILMGGMVDLEKSSKIFSIEASRRIGNSWRAELETRIFHSIDENELILSNFKDDSFLRVSISKFF